MNQEIAALKAQVELLRRELESSAKTFLLLDKYTHPNMECDAPAAAITELLAKTPYQCLATVEADAIDKLAKKLVDDDDSDASWWYQDYLEEYATKLRDGQ